MNLKEGKNRSDANEAKQLADNSTDDSTHAEKNLKKGDVDPSIGEALDVIRSFITETTGKAPQDVEIADALKRYFVLNEIKEHIKMVRGSEKTD